MRVGPASLARDALPVAVLPVDALPFAVLPVAVLPAPVAVPPIAAPDEEAELSTLPVISTWLFT